MVGENWQELAEFLMNESLNAFKQLESSQSPDIDAVLRALRRDLPEVAEYVIAELVGLGWQHMLVWLSDPSNRDRLADFVSRTEYPGMAWWVDGKPNSAPGL